LQFEQLDHPGTDHHEHLDDHLFRGALEHHLNVSAEVRIVVVDRVQLEAERARADHVRGEAAGHGLHVQPVGVSERLNHDGQHMVATFVDLAVCVLELSGRKARAQLLAHRPPPLALGEK